MVGFNTLVIILMILIALLSIAYALAPRTVSNYAASAAIKQEQTRSNQKCTTGCSCSGGNGGNGGNGSNGLDPVSEPSYNMKEVAKQSILLEDHLAIKAKRCTDCILKHFLSIVSYLNEAVCLAGDRIKEYPLLEESVKVYNNLFDEWFNNQWNEDKCLEIAGKLRDMRKEIVNEYYIKMSP